VLQTAFELVSKAVDVVWCLLGLVVELEVCEFLEWSIEGAEASLDLLALGKKFSKKGLALLKSFWKSVDFVFAAFDVLDNWNAESIEVGNHILVDLVELVGDGGEGFGVNTGNRVWCVLNCLVDTVLFEVSIWGLKGFL